MTTTSGVQFRTVGVGIVFVAISLVFLLSTQTWRSVRWLSVAHLREANVDALTSVSLNGTRLPGDSEEGYRNEPVVLADQSSSSQLQLRRGRRRLKLRAEFMDEGDTSRNRHNRDRQNMNSDRVHDSPTTAACLMFMNDDRNLREWIAYHYHVANLRHLIIRVDPKSQTQPDAILEPWRGRIHIDVWKNDTHVTPEDVLNMEEQFKWFDVKQLTPGWQYLIQNHDIFINRCLKKFKERDLGWTMVIDNDEYLRINYRTVSQWAQNHPGSDVVLTKPPPITEPGSVMTFLQQELDKKDKATISKTLTDSACIQFPRSRFGSVESSPEEIENGVPDGWNAREFDSLRFRHHAFPDRLLEGNTWGKAMVDLKRISMDELQDMGMMHMPVHHLCTYERMMWSKQKDYLFLVNHYLGSKESFFSRDEDRRTDHVFLAQANVEDENDDDIRPWFEGFIKVHGHKASRDLIYPD